MRFPIIGASDDDPGLGTTFAYLSSTHNVNWNATESRRQIPLTEAVQLADFSMTIDVAPGAGDSRTYTIRKNGVDTAATLTISDAATTGVWSGSVSFAAGDLIGIEATATGTPANPGNSYWHTFLHTDGNKALLMGGGTNVVGTAAINYANLFGATSWATAATDQDVPCPTTGTLTKAAWLAHTNPGAGKSYALSLRLNGSSDVLTTTISDSETADTATGSQALAAGDGIQVKSNPSGTPTAAAFAWCFTFVPDLPDETFIGFGVGTALSTTNTQYNQPVGVGAAYSTTESAKLMKPPAVTFKKLYVRLSAAPGGSAGRDITLRDNAGATSLLVSINAGATTGNDTTHTVKHTAGQSISIQSVPQSTPAAADLHLGMVMSVAQPSSSGSHY